MTQKTKDMLLAQLSQLSRKVERAGRAGRRHSFTALTQQLLLVQHFVDDNLPRHLRPAYDELLGGMATALSALPPQPSPEERQQTVQLLGELMGYLQKRTEELRTGKKLIVFLPYKASMWDSLESIWMAADKDKEHCDTMVVPIPYCDRNPDATVARWHYEINDFPKYVPVIDHRTVDLAKLHPDVIFIHNPYDNCNAVTSVDMQYYSRYLKNYTDNLVYVPYFVVGDTISPHFCQTPGVINADHVIVQDENIKEQYEKYYPGGNPPAGKFLALGSPKFDKVQHTTRADYTLPPEWSRLIKGRKVVLYNTSLTTMLNYTSFFCRKLREVFDFFRQRQDVVLWWRPHPLLRATFESMRPDYYDEYCALEQQYRNEGWGIYDDTPDVDRAIVCSDAYYGDLASSLVWLYRVTGKPMLFQGMSAVRFGRYHFLGIAEESADEWLIKPYTRNGLLRIDAQTGWVSVAEAFAHPVMVGNEIINAPYFAMHQVGQKIYLLPWGTQTMRTYDMRTGTYHSANLVQDEEKASLFIVGARAYGQRLYCWGYRYALLEFDMQTNRAVAVYQLPGVEPSQMNSYGLLEAACMMGSKLCLPLNQLNGFVWFDCETKESALCRVGNDEMRFVDAVAIDDQLWLLACTPHLIRYHMHTGTWQIYPLLDNKPLAAVPYFTGMCQLHDCLLMFPNYAYDGADEIVAHNLVTGVSSIIHRHAGGYSMITLLSEGRVAAQDIQRMEIDVYPGAHEPRTVSLRLSQQLNDEWHHYTLQQRSQLFMEGVGFSLLDFMQNIRLQADKKGAESTSAGEQIYRFLLEE